MSTEITSSAEQTSPASDEVHSLREQIIAGNGVLFAGTGISASTAECTGLPSRGELTESLLASLGRDREALSPGDASFPWAAQCYEIEQGRASLISFLKEKLGVIQEPLPVQQAIAALPFPLILTTNYDVLIERALSEKGIVYQRVIGDYGLRHKQPGVVRIVKLYGCITEPESMIITEEDLFAFLDGWPETLDTLGSVLSGKVFLFVGCDLKDRGFRRLYHGLAPRLREAGPAYALQMGLSVPLVRYWATRGLTVIEANAAEFLAGAAESIPVETVEEATSGSLLGPVELQAAELSVVGRVRTNNEDCVDSHMPSLPRLIAQRGSLFVVADGMGGHNAGEIASKLAVDRIVEEYYAGAAQDIPASLARAVEAANRVIHQQARENPTQEGMGTTVVAAAVRGQELHIANVGDSRAYFIHDGEMEQLTLDHSWVAEQVRAGILTPEQARNHPQGSLLTRSLGLYDGVEVDLFRRILEEGDIILLCSDGLTGHIEDAEIKEIASRHPPQSAVKRLVRLANARGGADNISVIVVKVGRGATEEKSALRRAISRFGLR